MALRIGFSKLGICAVLFSSMVFGGGIGCGGDPDGVDPIGLDLNEKADGQSAPWMISLTKEKPTYQAPCKNDRYDSANSRTCEVGFFPLQCKEWFNCQMIATVDIKITEELRGETLNYLSSNGNKININSCESYTIAAFDLDQYGYPLVIEVCNKDEDGELEISGKNTIKSLDLNANQGLRWGVSIDDQRNKDLYFFNVANLMLDVSFSWK